MGTAMLVTAARPRQGIAALRRFVRAPAAESCELCGTPIAPSHRHLLEPMARRLLCACLACAGAFTGGQARYRTVPQEVAPLADFQISEAQWGSLDLPIDIAFLFHSTPHGRPVALYPGPMGATESLPSLDAWGGLVTANPVLAALDPDVEALLANRINGRRSYWRVPIDRCFELVGVIRSQWQGWSGGDAVWQAIDRYCDGLDKPDGRAGQA
ncbi:MAG: DUF5947 family protein [Thiohalocapsa sp.]